MTTIIKSLPTCSTLLGFDFGLKKIGVAVGQTITATASPVGIIRVQNGQLPEQDLQKFIITWKPSALIVGIPLNMDGTPSLLTAHAEKFAQSLETRCALEVHRIDERLTSRSAWYELEEISERTRSKFKPKKLDAFAACLIIETWFASQG